MVKQQANGSIAKWNAALHPRDPSGRFRKVDLKPGWYPYRRGKEILEYYINENGSLSVGANALAMHAQYERHNQFRGVDDADATERIHLIATDNGEQMAVAASSSGVCGVIYPDRIAPPEPFSLARYSAQNEEIDKQLDTDETAYGGDPDRLATPTLGGNKLPPYDTLAANKAANINRQAFENENAKIWSTSPGVIAQEAVKAREWYQKNVTRLVFSEATGKHMRVPISETAARKLPVYVFVDGRNGRVHVSPAMKRNKHGNIVPAGSPNCKGGGGTVKLILGDLTKSMRSLQAEGVTNVDITVTRGSNRSKKGRALNNALHFRTTSLDKRTGEKPIIWGTLEQRYKGIDREKAQSYLTDEDGRLDPKKARAYKAAQVKERRRAAAPFTNPKSSQVAARLLHKRYGTWNAPEDIEMRKDGTFALENNSGIATIYRPDGERAGYEARSERGFAFMFNQGRPANQRIDEKLVKQRQDGGFDIAIPQRDGTFRRASYTRSGRVLSATID